MPDYEAMKREYPKLKAALTRAKNTKDNDKVLEAVRKAFDRFDVIGYPDAYSMWQRAADDAAHYKQMRRPFGG